MHLKFISHNPPSHYSPSSPIPGLAKFRSGPQNKTYELLGVFEKQYNLCQRAWRGLRALANTIRSTVLKIPLSEKIEKDWKGFWTGKKVTAFYQPYKTPVSEIAAEEVQAPNPPKEDFISPEIAKEFGNKFAGLERIHKILQVQQVPGVVVPLPKGLKHSQTEQFLKARAPQVFMQWENLGKKFASCADRAAFLTNPATISCLAQIRKEIVEAFATYYQDLDDQELNEWLKAMQQQGHYLMVRSSSVEDLAQVTNAGGNLSEAYIPPQLPQVLGSCGRLIASYFGEASLKNQIQAGLNPFARPLQLSVVLQELIGERVQGDQTQTPKEDIPVSLVLFTSEPNYSQRGFRVTTISSTFGHGEGVVNHEDVQTDTIYAVQSRAHPDNLVEIYQKQLKEERLAPVHSGEKTALQLVSNPPVLVNQRSLSKDMVKRLANLGAMIEKEMGKPMDLEIVIKQETIYIVQMRDIKRAPAQPTYLSDEILQGFGATPILATEYAKVLVPGKSDAQEIRSKKEILFCKTLKEAEERFVAGTHRCVVVTTDEPANSHPVINFSGLGIPCFYAERLSRDFIQQVHQDKPLVICPQSGRLCLWDRKIATPNQCMASGYFSHPAYMSNYLGSNNFAAAHETDKIPKDVQDALFALQIAQEQETALKVLHQLKQLPAVLNLEQKITQLEPHAGPQVKLLKKLNKRIQQAFAEIEASYQHSSPRLEKLFHIKTLSTLLANNRSFSLLQAGVLIEQIERGLAYQKKLSAPAKFIHLLPLGDQTLAAQDKQKWEAFLLDLEKLPLDQQKIEKFQELIEAIRLMGCVPLWMNLILLPSLGKSSTAEILKSLISESEKQIATIKNMNRLSKEIEGVKLSLFSHPNTFDAAWKKLKPLMEQMSRPELLDGLSDSKLARLLVGGLMKTYADFIDEAVKTMKGSPHFSDQEKLEKLDLMLKGNYQVLKVWAIKANQQEAIPFKNGLDLNQYFNFIETAWQKCNTASLNSLKPSAGFSVLAAALGSQTLISRHTPQTLEDLFTLIHQNQLFVISHLAKPLLTDTLMSQLGLPKLFTDALPMLGKVSYHTSTRTGLSLTERGIKVAHNFSLNNHSASVELEWDKKLGVQMHVKFFGERGRQRWKAIAQIVEILNDAGIIKVRKMPAYTDQEIQYTWEVTEETLPIMFRSFECAVTIADGGRHIPRFAMEFAKSLESHGEKLVQSIIKRSDKTGDIMYNLPEWFLTHYKDSPLIKQELQRIRNEYGKSDDKKTVHKEIVHLISMYSALFLYKDIYGDTFKEVVPRYADKAMSEKKKKILERLLQWNTY